MCAPNIPCRSRPDQRTQALKEVASVGSGLSIAQAASAGSSKMSPSWLGRKTRLLSTKSRAASSALVSASNGRARPCLDQREAEENSTDDGLLACRGMYLQGVRYHPIDASLETRGAKARVVRWSRLFAPSCFHKIGERSRKTFRGFHRRAVPVDRLAISDRQAPAHF